MSNAFDQHIPRGRRAQTQHLHTHTHTHLHSYARADRQGVRKVNTSLFLPFHSVPARSLFPLLQVSIFHNVLNLSAGHRCGTSKSLLLANYERYERMKWQQTQAPWNKYRNARCVRWEKRSRKGEVGEMLVYDLEDQSKMQRRCQKHRALHG